MLYIFNKELRAFDNVVSRLKKKIRKSVKLELEYDGNYEIYHLDDVNITFSIDKNCEIKVADIFGEPIVFLDCHFDLWDKTQRFKSDRFSDLLQYVRQEKDKREKKSLAKEKEIKAMLDDKHKAETDFVRVNILNNASKKLR